MTPDVAGIPGLKSTRIPRDERRRVRHRDASGATHDGIIEYAVYWADAFVGVLVAFDVDPGDLVHMHPHDLEDIGAASLVIPPAPRPAALPSNVVRLPVRPRPVPVSLAHEFGHVPGGAA